MLRDESKAAKESWNGKTRAFDREPCTIDATDMYTYDFQQNLLLPTLTHSDVFYCCQLWVYYFDIHDCVSDDGVMHLWDEKTAKRGSFEVASCHIDVCHKEAQEQSILSSSLMGVQAKTKTG